ncbi:MAG: helix-turn-helix domain-containing protein [Myxococcota bacterium]|nr:helix-turn-helix domain-containing protein [Myxococcota bacterium]
MSNEPGRVWVTVSEAAAILGVSTKTLRRWDAEGKLTPHRHPTNGYRLYDRDEVAGVATRVGRGTSSHALFEERREALERLDRARAQRPRCITLFGVAGVGKSTVAAAFAAERGPSVVVRAEGLEPDVLRRRVLDAGGELQGAGLLVVDDADRDDVPWGELCDALPDAVDVLLVRRLPLDVRGEHGVALTPLATEAVDAIARRAQATMPEVARLLGLPACVERGLLRSRASGRSPSPTSAEQVPSELVERVRSHLPESVLRVLSVRDDRPQSHDPSARLLAARLGLLAADGSPSALGEACVSGRASFVTSTEVLEPSSSRRWEQLDRDPAFELWSSAEPTTAAHRVAHWRRLGQLRRARSELVRAVAHTEDLGDADMLAQVWLEQGALAAASGGEEAEGVLGAAHVMLERCGRHEDAALALGHLARVLFAKRCFERAERTALRWHATACALDLRRQRDDALALLSLATYRRHGSIDALRRYVDALATEESYGAWWEALERRARLVDVLIDRGEHATAVPHVARGRELSEHFDHLAFAARFERAEAMIALDSGQPLTRRAVPDADTIGVLEHARAQVTLALGFAPARWSLAEAPFEAASRAYALAGDRELSVACHRFAVVARVLSGGRSESPRLGPNGRCATLALEALKLAERRPGAPAPRRHRTWDALASHDVLARVFARLVLAVERRREVAGPAVTRKSGEWRIDDGRLDLRSTPQHELALSAIAAGARTVVELGRALWPDASTRVATARARRLAEDVVRLTQGAVGLDDDARGVAIRWCEPDTHTPTSADRRGTMSG